MTSWEISPKLRQAVERGIASTLEDGAKLLAEQHRQPRSWAYVTVLQAILLNCLEVCVEVEPHADGNPQFRRLQPSLNELWGVCHVPGTASDGNEREVPPGYTLVSAHGRRIALLPRIGHPRWRKMRVELDDLLKLLPKPIEGKIEYLLDDGWELFPAARRRVSESLGCGEDEASERLVQAAIAGEIVVSINRHLQAQQAQRPVRRPIQDVLATTRRPAILSGCDEEQTAWLRSHLQRSDWRREHVDLAIARWMVRASPAKASTAEPGSMCNDKAEPAVTDGDTEAPQRSAHPRVTNVAIRECHQWLKEMISRSPERPRRKDDVWTEAKAKWRNHLSRAAYNRNWARAIEETGATAWNLPGPRTRKRSDRFGS